MAERWDRFMHAYIGRCIQFWTNSKQGESYPWSYDLKVKLKTMYKQFSPLIQMFHYYKAGWNNAASTLCLNGPQYLSVHRVVRFKWMNKSIHHPVIFFLCLKGAWKIEINTIISPTNVQFIFLTQHALVKCLTWESGVVIRL